MMIPEPTREHEWLLRLVGDWTMEGSCMMGPDQPPATLRGTESMRAIGKLWVVGEGQGEMPGGGTATNIITFGFDPRKGRFVGSFISSAMPMMWIYDGALDAAGEVLTLDCDGPDFTDPTRTLKYQDIVELTPDGRRLLRSRVQDTEGNWQQIMSAEYRRV